MDEDCRYFCKVCCLIKQGWGICGQVLNVARVRTLLSVQQTGRIENVKIS